MRPPLCNVLVTGAAGGMGRLAKPAGVTPKGGVWAICGKLHICYTEAVSAFFPDRRLRMALPN